jgi:hypothetical protein
MGQQLCNVPQHAGLVQLVNRLNILVDSLRAKINTQRDRIDRSKKLFRQQLQQIRVGLQQATDHVNLYAFMDSANPWFNVHNPQTSAFIQYILATEVFRDQLTGILRTIDHVLEGNDPDPNNRMFSASTAVRLAGEECRKMYKQTPEVQIMSIIRATMVGLARATNVDDTLLRAEFSALLASLRGSNYRDASQAAMALSRELNALDRRDGGTEHKSVRELNDRLERVSAALNRTRETCATVSQAALRTNVMMIDRIRQIHGLVAAPQQPPDITQDVVAALRALRLQGVTPTTPDQDVVAALNGLQIRPRANPQPPAFAQEVANALAVFQNETSRYLIESIHHPLDATLLPSNNGDDDNVEFDAIEISIVQDGMLVSMYEWMGQLIDESRDPHFRERWMNYRRWFQEYVGAVQRKDRYPVRSNLASEFFRKMAQKGDLRELDALVTARQVLVENKRVTQRTYRAFDRLSFWCSLLREIMLPQEASGVRSFETMVMDHVRDEEERRRRLRGGADMEAEDEYDGDRPWDLQLRQYLYVQLKSRYEIAAHPLWLNPGAPGAFDRFTDDAAGAALPVVDQTRAQQLVEGQHGAKFDFVYQLADYVCGRADEDVQRMVRNTREALRVDHDDVAVMRITRDAVVQLGRQQLSSAFLVHAEFMRHVFSVFAGSMEDVSHAQRAAVVNAMNTSAVAQRLETFIHDAAKKQAALTRKIEQQTRTLRRWSKQYAVAAVLSAIDRVSAWTPTQADLADAVAAVYDGEDHQSALRVAEITQEIAELEQRLARNEQQRRR